MVEKLLLVLKIKLLIFSDLFMLTDSEMLADSSDDTLVILNKLSIYLFQKFHFLNHENIQKSFEFFIFYTTAPNSCAFTLLISLSSFFVLSFFLFDDFLIIIWHVLFS